MSTCRSSGATTSCACCGEPSWSAAWPLTGGLRLHPLPSRPHGSPHPADPSRAPDSAAGPSGFGCSKAGVAAPCLLPACQRRCRRFVPTSQPAPLLAAAAPRRAAAAEDFEEHAQPLLEKYPGRLRPDFLTLDNFHAAASFVASRAFGVDEWHGAAAWRLRCAARACRLRPPRRLLGAATPRQRPFAA